MDTPEPQQTPSEPVAPVAVEALFTQPAQPPANQPPSTAVAASQPKRRHWGRRILFGVLALILIVGGLVGSTEAGWIHTGIDRWYGKTRLALIWGGMPEDANTALRAALQYATHTSLPDKFTIGQNTTLSATVHMSALDSLMPTTSPVDTSTNPFTDTTDTISGDTTDATNESVQFFQILDAAVSELPTQTNLDLSDSAAPALNSLAPEDITANATLALTGQVFQSAKQFSVTANVSAESTIPDWKSVSAKSTIIRDNDTLYVQVPDLSSWPLEATMTDTYRPYFGKYVAIPIPETTQADLERYLSEQNSVLTDLQDNNLISQEQLDGIISLIAERTHRVGIERVDGHAASHWQFSLNKSSLVSFVTDLQDILASNTPADSPLQNVDSASVDQSISAYEAFLPDFTLTIDMWVRHGDYVVVKSQEQLTLSSAYLTANLNADSSLTNIPAKQTSTIDLPDPADTITEQALSDAISDAPYMPTYGASTPYERDQIRVADMRMIQTLIEEIALQRGLYPYAPTVQHLDDPTATVTTALQNYEQSVTTFEDPLPEQYYYGYTSDGNSYTLTAVIEDPSLTTCTQTGSICLYTLSANSIPTPLD